jgi:hypothetical protein
MGERLMQLSRFVPKLLVLMVLGLPGFGGGCGSGSAPMPQEDSEKVRESRKGLHKEIKQAQKEGAKKITEEKQKQSSMRKGAHRGAGGQ